ncbi:MAG: hypothetical protein HUJ26_14545 [Planctomycetaceae bacterium]|nr:hypothetical protein [Planctomycetaceae bacterium]
MHRLGFLFCLMVVSSLSLGCGGGDSADVVVDETPETEQPMPENDDMQAEAAGGVAN